jgi:hypothetical protein
MAGERRTAALCNHHEQQQLNGQLLYLSTALPAARNGVWSVARESMGHTQHCLSLLQPVTPRGD